jgi:hypothetical protein
MELVPTWNMPQPQAQDMPMEGRASVKARSDANRRLPGGDDNVLEIKNGLMDSSTDGLEYCRSRESGAG